MRWLVAFAVLSSSAWAQDDVGNHGMGRGQHTNHLSDPRPAKSLPGEVSGHCTLLKGGGNPLEGPCVNTLLILRNAKGSELARTRTDDKGDFKFEALKEGPYRVATSSRLLTIVAPARNVSGKDAVRVKIRQN